MFLSERLRRSWRLVLWWRISASMEILVNTLRSLWWFPTRNSWRIWLSNRALLLGRSKIYVRVLRLRRLLSRSWPNTPRNVSFFFNSYYFQVIWRLLIKIINQIFKIWRPLLLFKHNMIFQQISLLVRPLTKNIIQIYKIEHFSKIWCPFREKI